MQTSSDAVITVEGVSKSFDSSPAVAGSHRTPVLSNVSFEVHKGETVCIIGRNGAGKSTLLRIVAGITEADSGSVSVKGKATSIIGLQSGFNGRLSGRDNVLAKAAIMGLDRTTIRERLESILEFADLGPHIDKPLNSYSNGMRARLAFSVAFHVDPELLIVDESLAVGDHAFNNKCQRRIEEIRASGATILLVTHALALVTRIASRAYLLEGGEFLEHGDPTRVVETYRTLMTGKTESSVSDSETIPNAVELTDINICIKEDDSNSHDLTIRGKLQQSIPQLIFYRTSLTHRGHVLWSDIQPANEDPGQKALAEQFELRYQIADVLTPNTYEIEFAAVTDEGKPLTTTRRETLLIPGKDDPSSLVKAATFISADHSSVRS